MKKILTESKFVNLHGHHIYFLDKVNFQQDNKQHIVTIFISVFSVEHTTKYRGGINSKFQQIALDGLFLLKAIQII